MKYINTKTGMVIDVPCEVKGDWKPLEEDAPKKPAKKTKKKKGADKK